jgi:hypothetical protein
MQQELIINHLSSVLCRLSSVLGPSTTVENPLQIDLFMQNKPNFRESQMNSSIYYTIDYNNETAFRRGKTNPIQTQTKPISEKPK